MLNYILSHAYGVHSHSQPLNSPLAEGFSGNGIAPSAEGDEGLFSPAGSVGASVPQGHFLRAPSAEVSTGHPHPSTRSL